jgi:hypothetical protein
MWLAIVHHYCAFSCPWRHARKNMVNNGLESNRLLHDFNINNMENYNNNSKKLL